MKIVLLLMVAPFSNKKLNASGKISVCFLAHDIGLHTGTTVELVSSRICAWEVRSTPTTGAPFIKTKINIYFPS